MPNVNLDLSGKSNGKILQQHFRLPWTSCSS